MRARCQPVDRPILNCTRRIVPIGDVRFAGERCGSSCMPEITDISERELARRIRLVFPAVGMRGLLYALLWLPPLVVMSILYAKMNLIISKLAGRGTMPEETEWVWTFFRVNSEWYHLPVLLLLLGAVGVAEVVVVFGRRRGLIAQQCCC